MELEPKESKLSAIKAESDPGNVPLMALSLKSSTLSAVNAEIDAGNVPVMELEPKSIAAILDAQMSRLNTLGSVPPMPLLLWSMVHVAATQSVAHENE